MSAVATDFLQPATVEPSESARYARMVTASKRVRWDIDADVIRGRHFDYSCKFLPDALSKVDALTFLTEDERRRLSHVQGRTYAYIFGLVERFIAAKVLEQSGQHWLGDQHALEALIRFSDEELKHQELFRRIETMIDADMPAGYTMVADPNAVASSVLGKSTWSVLALTAHIELFVQAHYAQTMDGDATLSPLWKDVFMYHWQEECQHAMLDELEWKRENRRLTPEQRDAAVDDLIALVAAVDGILQAQAAADSRYFLGICTRSFTPVEQQAMAAVMLRAYRWQYIRSGVQHPHFVKLLTGMTTPAQMERITTSLGPILTA
jgi:hypothetical protein